MRRKQAAARSRDALPPSPEGRKRAASWAPAGGPRGLLPPARQRERFLRLRDKMPAPRPRPEGPGEPAAPRPCRRPLLREHSPPCPPGGRGPAWNVSAFPVCPRNPGRGSRVPFLASPLGLSITLSCFFSHSTCPTPAPGGRRPKAGVGGRAGGRGPRPGPGWRLPRCRPRCSVRWTDSVWAESLGLTLEGIGACDMAEGAAARSAF